MACRWSLAWNEHLGVVTCWSFANQFGVWFLVFGLKLHSLVFDKSSTARWSPQLVHHDPQLWYTTEWSWTSLRDLAPAHGAGLTFVDPRDVFVGDKSSHTKHTHTYFLIWQEMFLENGVLFWKRLGGNHVKICTYTCISVRNIWTQPASFKDTWALEEMFSQIQNVSPVHLTVTEKNEINNCKFNPDIPPWNCQRNQQVL